LRRYRNGPGEHYQSGLSRIVHKRVSPSHYVRKQQSVFVLIRSTLYLEFFRATLSVVANSRSFSLAAIKSA
jgi:hypothetical protein